MDSQRKVGVYTTFGKKYVGLLDVPNKDVRTTDLMNSSNIFWKNPDMKCLNNSIMLHDAVLALNDNAVYKKFHHLQVKTDEIIFFYDDTATITNEMEKKRSESMLHKSHEIQRKINIITPVISNSFYDINELKNQLLENPT